MSKSTKKNIATSKKLSRRGKVLIGIASGIVLILLLVGLGSGQVQFWAMKAVCGKDPVILNDYPNIFVSASNDYVLPGYAKDSLYKPTFYSKYACNEQEFIDRGYSIDIHSQGGLERLGF